MALSETKKLVLRSKFEEMGRLEPFINELKEWIGCSEEDSSRIMLTLSEAVNNAIMHGNAEDPQKQVVVVSEWCKNNNSLKVSVEDEGEGFDPDEIPDPLKEENLFKKGGRGVYLIEQYADKVSFSKQGTKITITFKLGKE